jgi:hypothetical protein
MAIFHFGENIPVILGELRKGKTPIPGRLTLILT